LLQCCNKNLVINIHNIIELNNPTSSWHLYNA